MKKIVKKRMTLPRLCLPFWFLAGVSQGSLEASVDCGANRFFFFIIIFIEESDISSDPPPFFSFHSYFSIPPPRVPPLPSSPPSLPPPSFTPPFSHILSSLYSPI